MLISSLRRAPSRIASLGGTTFALLAPCSLRPSGQWEGLPPAWPIFQPPSGVELAFRYSDGFHTGSCLGVALRLPCLIFGSGEDDDPPIGTGRAAARILRRDDPVVCVFDLVPKGDEHVGRSSSVSDQALDSFYTQTGCVSKVFQGWSCSFECTNPFSTL